MWMKGRGVRVGYASHNHLFLFLFALYLICWESLSLYSFLQYFFLQFHSVWIPSFLLFPFPTLCSFFFLILFPLCASLCDSFPLSVSLSLLQHPPLTLLFRRWYGGQVQLIWNCFLPLFVRICRCVVRTSLIRCRFNWILILFIVNIYR